tara:strand:+ start:45937 stop:47661 length:1725 start_codon:yes stop_codon:yes gene_type:complete
MAADTVGQIKEKLTIVEVVGSYVKLTRAGKHHRGLSPFNKEKTPSFYVNSERGSYYCFSSGQGGDIFTFIEKMEGVDFKGALKILAEKAGVELVYEKGASGVDKNKKDRLYEACARAESFYSDLLMAGKDVPGSAYAYARSRGLSDETIKEWGLGFAPDGWRGLYEKLLSDGFIEVELLAAGLIKEADEKKGTFYDRFRNRLMFPIRDAAGRTVGFTGRALDPKDQAKYLNSPETDLYKKSDILFGMDKAKDAIRTRGFALMVEGQMDLLMLHQIGFKNTIALSGTALTPSHLALIKRYADNLMLALDSDRAGLAASQKNAITALQSGMRVKAVHMPSGKDPADLALEEPKELTKRIADASSIVEFFLQVLAENYPDSLRLLVASERAVLPLIANMESAMEREHFVGIVARTLGSTPEAVREGLERTRRTLSAEEGKEVSAPSTKQVSVQRPVKKVMGLAEKHATLVRAIAESYPGTTLANRLQNEYSRIIGSSFPEDPLPEADVFEAGIAYGEHPDENAADELLLALEKAILTERLADVTKQLRTAEAAGDEMQARALTDECRTLARKLSALS